jgi:hypothetical protein
MGMDLKGVDGTDGSFMSGKRECGSVKKGLLEL